MKKLFLLLIIGSMTITGCVSVSDKNEADKKTEGISTSEFPCEESPTKITDHTYSGNPCLLGNSKINNVKAVMKTTLGTIEFELFGEDAPYTVSNFVFLADFTIILFFIE